jgi:ubiquinone/menaquinone biosynthesis C-methylase UbiE
MDSKNGNCGSTRNGDYLKINLAELPYFRALLRAVESRFYSGIKIVNPVLDLGCGDGHFTNVTFENLHITGIDPQLSSLLEAKKYYQYNYLLNSLGGELPFKNKAFKTCISNSVLEHIPDIDKVIKEIARVLDDDGHFVFCVPNQNFTKHLSIAIFLDRIHFFDLSRSYRIFFNRISRHYHCDSFITWNKRLAGNGFEIIDQWDYFSPSAIRCLEWGHYLGIPYWISKKIFGKWVIWPGINQSMVYKKIEKYYFEEPKQKEGAYSFYITRKI